MNLNRFLQKLKDSPENIEFTDTMAVIDELYEFTETEFKNGNLLNKAGENSGSCKLFALVNVQPLKHGVNYKPVCWWFVKSVIRINCRSFGQITVKPFVIRRCWTLWKRFSFLQHLPLSCYQRLFITWDEKARKKVTLKKLINKPDSVFYTGI